MPPSGTRFDFVHVAGTETSEEAARRRRTVYSHVARTIHARTRHARIAEHQALVNSSYTQNRTERLLDEDLGTEAVRHATPDTTDMAELPMGYGSAMAPMSIIGLSGADPFQSLSMPLSPTETFLFHHYLTVVLPYRETHCPYREVQQKSYIDSMSRGWVRLAIGDTSFLSGVLMVAARNLSQVQHGQHDHQKFARMAAEYKSVCMQAVRESITSSSATIPAAFSDSTVAEVLVLAADELALGNSDTCTQHIQGAAKMLGMNGGKQVLGLRGFLDLVLHKYAGYVGLSL